MQHFWLNKKNNKKLIVIFNGWGMNESPFKHLNCGDYDVLILSDYRKFDINLDDFGFEKYSLKCLIAWSMGVYTSGNYCEILNKFDKKIAINGTAPIVDDNFGIPNKIYDITIEYLNEAGLDKFIKNMFTVNNLNPEITITRNVEELKEELIKIKELKIKGSIKFDKVIISMYDRIIPPKNQLAFWENKAQIIKIPSTHCPFKEYKTFEEIIWN